MALLHQLLGADEHRIARKGGETLVGRVAVAGGAQGKHLPIRLASGNKEIHKLVGLVTKVANAGSPGKGSGVHQDTTAARESHLWNLRVLCWFIRVTFIIAEFVARCTFRRAMYCACVLRCT